MGNYDELPQEIRFAIMCRVPAKSVGLCRCVSKPWRALLSQPDFVETHLQHAKTNSLESLAIICYDNGTSESYFVPLNNAHYIFDELTLPLTKLSFPGYNPLSVYNIYGSIDGLFLATIYGGKMMVMNPITGQIREVPPPPLSIDRRDVFIVYGLGYDSVRDDYKIVIMSANCFNFETLKYVTTFVDVYSLKTGSWKRLESPPYNVRSDLTKGAFVGGCVHRLYNREADGKIAILAFDLIEEKFREVPLPSLIFDNLEAYYTTDVFDYELGVLNGCLCMFFEINCGQLWVMKEHGVYEIKYGEVWVMKEYGVLESWTKFVVNKPYGWRGCLLSCQEQAVMTFDDGNHCLGNLKQGTWKNIVFNGFSGCLKNLRVVATFIESLISPHGRV